MRKHRRFYIAVLIIGILIGINRICFANFDSTVGYGLAERTAEKAIAKQFPNIDLSEAKVDVSSSLRIRYEIFQFRFKFRGDIQVLYFWEESGESISVFLNGYLPLWADEVINRTSQTAIAEEKNEYIRTESEEEEKAA